MTTDSVNTFFLTEEEAIFNEIQLRDLNYLLNFNLSGLRKNVSSPLYYASEAGLLESMKTLLDKGAEISAQDGEYRSALIGASSREYIEIVQMLLEKGADVKAQGGKYENTLVAASFKGSIEIV